jgi:hypothetical protein
VSQQACPEISRFLAPCAYNAPLQRGGYCSNRAGYVQCEVTQEDLWKRHVFLSKQVKPWPEMILQSQQLSSLRGVQSWQDCWTVEVLGLIPAASTSQCTETFGCFRMRFKALHAAPQLQCDTLDHRQYMQHLLNCSRPCIDISAVAGRTQTQTASQTQQRPLD